MIKLLLLLTHNVKTFNERRLSCIEKPEMRTALKRNVFYHADYKTRTRKIFTQKIVYVHHNQLYNATNPL
jgi:hypothetical protein